MPLDPSKLSPICRVIGGLLLLQWKFPISATHHDNTSDKCHSHRHPYHVQVFDNFTYSHTPSYSISDTVALLSCNAVRPVFKTHKERRSRTIPKEKITLSLQDQTNTPGYIARTCAHYNRTIGKPQSTILYKVGKIFINQSQPNSHTPRTQPRLCQPMAPKHNTQQTASQHSHARYLTNMGGCNPNDTTHVMSHNYRPFGHRWP